MKDIPGYEGKYAALEDGRIWTYERRDTLNRKVYGKYLKFKLKYDGYLGVKLCSEGDCHHYVVHRLIAAAYLPNPDNLPYINHKNGVKDDNRVENLEWCTGSQNVIHAFATGLTKPSKGSQHYKAAFSEKDIPLIRQLYHHGFKHEQIAALFGVTRTAIQSVILGKSWMHVP